LFFSDTLCEILYSFKSEEQKQVIETGKLQRAGVGVRSGTEAFDEWVCEEHGERVFRVVVAVISTLQEKGIKAAGFPFCVPRQLRTVSRKESFIRRILLKLGGTTAHRPKTMGFFVFLLLLAKKQSAKKKKEDVP